MPYFVYILECQDGTLYTGITNNLEKRLLSHQAGTASRYTRSHGAVGYFYTEMVKDKSNALKRECEIKKLPRSKKLQLHQAKPASKDN